jgi:hypothetical protein
MGRSKNSKYLSCGCCIDYSYTFNDNAKGSHYKFGDDDEPRYKKQSRRGKKCKKSADGKHSYNTVYTTYGYRRAWNETQKKFVWSYGEVTKYKCSNCGKPSHKSFP